MEENKINLSTSTLNWDKVYFIIKVTGNTQELLS